MGIAVVEQRPDAGARRQPRVLRRIGHVLEQPSRALQPAVGDRLLAAERGRIPGEPDGQARRAASIAALAVGAIGAFADVEHRVGEIEPPGGQPQPLERLGLLAFAGRQGFERLQRRVPLAAIERGLAGRETGRGFGRCGGKR